MGKRLEFEERFTQAKEEIKSYNEKNYSFEKMTKILKEYIFEFISDINNKQVISLNAVYEYNLAELYHLNSNNQDYHINEFLMTKLLPNYNPLEILSNDSLHYVYVVQRFDGMVCVVGRSQFSTSSKINVQNAINKDSKLSTFNIEIESSIDKIGDLFMTIVPSSPLNLTGTQKLIYKLLNQSEKDFESITKDMKNYYAQAFVIPVKGGKNMADTIESLLGEYLLSKSINILNIDSHLW
ncbi:hypothetical protein BHU61_00390 [Macrococcus epidermidis]|uniref:Uncharacterized protein n=1 Tax=Macrococcus epidermidis TaxID=1902580 RepID=A0A327ZUW9_9STAP|nr:hypothetical protein [Macrococcus epidermidis]RAK45937.1 hypothetical protein BHU61_00390 [Macrococcus epidermidis]